MATFTWIPDIGASVDHEPRVKTAQFGEGYEQVAQDGLNSNMRKRSLAFTGRSDAEIQAIADFLDAQGGAYAFDYTHPGDSTSRRYRCRKWQIVDTEYGRSLSCEFYQVPA